MNPAEIAVVVGTRPEAVKLAPVVNALRATDWCRVRIVATAQHRELLDQILAFFGLEADLDLDVMQPDQSPAELVTRMVPRLDDALARLRPDFVLGQGDTTTVFVTALCCFLRGVPFGHVEAGLRTHRRRSPFPEEMNRTLVADLADLHFAPTARAVENLLSEGIARESIEETGNTVVDALLWTANRVAPTEYAPDQGRRLVLVTAHRREHLGAPLERICDAVRTLAARGDVDVVYPVHPNPNVRAIVERTLGGARSVRLVEPLGYPEFVAAMKASHLILTDSGGVQEEAPTLGRPVLVMRDETERPEGVEAGTSILVGTDAARIVEETVRLLDDPSAYREMSHRANPFGDGHAAERIEARLRRVLGR